MGEGALRRRGRQRLEGARHRGVDSGRSILGGEHMKSTTTGLLAASAFFSSLAIAENGVTANRILLGQAAVFSGPAAQLGIQMRNGIKAYFDQVNDNGGVHGRKLELVTEDDQYEAARAPAASKKLIEEYKVFALLGYVGTPTGAAHLPVVTQARVPLVGMFTGAEILRDPLSRYVFHVRASYYDETDKIVEQVVSTGGRKISVFYQADSYGEAGRKGTEIALAKR